jgi:predicted transcriptional regulator of viral defense system
MQKNPDREKIKNFKLLTAAQLRKHLGVSQATLSRLVKDESIIRLGFGLYSHPDCNISPKEIDFAVACARFGPKSAIGGLSALFHYGLTDQPPSQVWIIAPPQKSDHNKFYRSIRTKTSPKEGINEFEFYRMTNIERTLIEALRFGTKIGLRVAINAVRKALQRKLTTEKKLGEMATKLKLRSVLEKHWEAIVT